MIVDFHSHLLPGIDDGAKDMDQALAMARIAVDDGITDSVLTPHHLNGVYANPAGVVRDYIRSFEEALKGAGIELDVIPGSELHLVPELPEALASGEAMTVADRGRVALVELPVHSVPVGTDRILGQILEQGIIPVIAHPERNSRLRKEPELLAEWVEMGCLAQVTAQSCTGRFGPEVEKAAHHMVTTGLIHVVASDAHRDRRRVPAISEGRAAIEAWTNPSVAQLLGEVYPRSLVNGQPVSTAMLRRALPEPRARSGWRRMLGLR